MQQFATTKVAFIGLEIFMYISLAVFFHGCWSRRDPPLGTYCVEAIYEPVAFYLFVTPSVLFKQHGGSTVTKKVLGKHRMDRGRRAENEKTEFR